MIWMWMNACVHVDTPSTVLNHPRANADMDMDRLGHIYVIRFRFIYFWRSSGKCRKPRTAVNVDKTGWQKIKVNWKSQIDYVHNRVSQAGFVLSLLFCREWSFSLLHSFQRYSLLSQLFPLCLSALLILLLASYKFTNMNNGRNNKREK